jgi:hypothetical protein
VRSSGNAFSRPCSAGWMRQAARAEVRRLTLAPPLARAACRIHPALHGLLNALPLLRTHRLVWLRKPA